MNVIFQTTFPNAYAWLNIKVNLMITILKKFIPLGPINNIPAMVQIMAWHRPGHMPLY